MQKVEGSSPFIRLGSDLSFARWGPIRTRRSVLLGPDRGTCEIASV
jgi:hypothetical protein